MKQMIALLLAMVMAFAIAGCREDQPQETLDPNYDWKETAGLTYGQMSTEKLRVISWDRGRADATGWDMWAETEAGYYFLSISTGTLHYADKTNLDKWAVVCNQPNCSHSRHSEKTCSGILHGNSFLLRDERLYFVMEASYCQHLHNLEGNAFVLCSSALDGTDLRLEYAIEEAQTRNGGNSSDMLLPDGWLYNVITLNTDGGETATTYFVGESGQQILFQEQYGPDEDGSPSTSRHGLEGFRMTRGDRIFRNHMLGEGLYRLAEGQIESLNLPVEMVIGKDGLLKEGYLSGDIFRQLRTNDGYYDINVKTGEEIKIAEPRLENSHAMILLPNCIIECSNFSKEAPANEERIMEIYDGESWRTVALPEELRYVNQPGATAQFVGSDRIVFLSSSYSGNTVMYKVYQVLLDREELVMELCGIFNSRD